LPQRGTAEKGYCYIGAEEEEESQTRINPEKKSVPGFTVEKMRLDLVVKKGRQWSRRTGEFPGEHTQCVAAWGAGRRRFWAIPSEISVMHRTL
jgi:hypothetical protein